MRMIDWGKLKRILRYLKGTKRMKLRLSFDNSEVIKWGVDTSYNMHYNCHRHTGAFMSLRKGAW